jgi:hypothetical protein
MMRFRSLAFCSLLILPACASTPGGQAAAPERAAFVTLLGNDTVAVERITRSGDELHAEVLLRVPRTTLHVYRMQLDAEGRPTSLETTAHDPAAGPDSPPRSRETVRWGADSVRIETTGGQAPGTAAVAGGRDVLPFIDMVHWPFELMLQRAHAAPGDSLVIPLLTGRRTQPFTVRRTGARDYTVTHPFRGTMTTQVDAQGRLTHLDAARTTRALRVTRVPEVSLAALARDFAAREASQGAPGELSGRGEAEATVAGASIGVDFGQPRKRGREIFGALVPWDQVWRTGANRATHLTTDRDLVIGGTTVPAGTYTLFSIPRSGTWTLIVNRRTNINGTAYDAAHDLARVEMQTRTLPEVVEDFTIRVDPQGEGGVLRIQWDRTEAYVPFQVRAGR